jgi:hypothetical protein
VLLQVPSLQLALQPEHQPHSLLLPLLLGWQQLCCRGCLQLLQQHLGRVEMPRKQQLRRPLGKTLRQQLQQDHHQWQQQWRQCMWQQQMNP